MRNSYNAVLALLAFLGVAAAGGAQAQNMPSARPQAELISPTPGNDNGARNLMHFAANNDTFDKDVTETARTLFRRQIADCQTAAQAVRQLPTPYGGVTFPVATPTDKFPAPTNGLWAEHVKVRGCDRVYQINMLAVARTGAAPLILTLLPGETLSDPGQQGNILRMAAQAIRKADANCSDDAVPGYTRLLGHRQPDGALGKEDSKLGWFEEWTFGFCRKQVPVQVAFLPNGNGGYDIRTRVVGATNTAPPASKPEAPKTQQLLVQ